MKVKIKICGMKFSENITEIATLLPDYLGFIFYEKSPRYLENNIPFLDKSIQKVGVFVNPTFEEVKEKVTQYKLDLVQLHGEEPEDFCILIENIGIKVIKAFSVDNLFKFSILETYKNSCSYFLFDTKGRKYGGNGTVFDWRILKNYSLDKPYFLSGGIGLEHTDAFEEFSKKEYAKNCISLDLNSRFEIEPGLKNLITLKEFIQQIK